MSTLAEAVKIQQDYRRIFVDAHGPFPHPCYFCAETVEATTGPVNKWTAVVHHVDHDHFNHAPDNLVPAHWGCHRRYHGRNQDAAVLERIGAANRGRKHTPETRAKIAEAARNRSLEARANLSAATSAHMASLTAEQKAERTRKQKATRAANTETEARRAARFSAAMTGRTLTDEHRAKVSAGLNAHHAARRAAGIKRTLSDEQRAQISARQKGRKLSPEHAAKIAASNRGKTMSAEARAKISAAKLGKKRSPDQIARMSDAAKRGWANMTPEARAASVAKVKATKAAKRAAAVVTV